MAMSGAERQAAFQERQRKALADALAEVESLRVRVAILERERDRLNDLVGYAVKREAWAGAAINDVATKPPQVVMLRALPRDRPLSAQKADHGRIGPLIPSWLLPTPD